MHSLELILEIHRLLQQGELSQREIAERLRVSRGTISAIARGNRGLYGRESQGVYVTLAPSSRAIRCPECGYRVYLPCIICRIRQHQHNRRLVQLLAAQQRPKELAKTPRKRRKSGTGMTTAEWHRAVRQKPLGLRGRYFRAS